MKTDMRYFNLISFLLIIAGAIFLGVRSGDIALTARVYPLILIALVIVCSLAIAAREIIGRSAPAKLDADLTNILSAPTASRARLTAFCITWLVYPWVMSRAGFLVATVAAIALSLWLLKIRRPVVALVAAVAFALAFSVIFATALYIPTPSGPLDNALAEYLYTLQQ